MFPFYFFIIITRKRGLDRGNDFTPVCNSFQGKGRGSIPRGRGLCPGELSVQGIAVQEGLCPWAAPCQGGSLSREFSVQGGLCPGSFLSRGGSLARELSVQGGSLSRGSLSTGFPVQGGGVLCQGDSPHTVKRQAVCILLESILV